MICGQQNLDNYYIAGCEGAPGSVALEKEMGIPADHKHCNGGLLLINLKAVRSDNIEKKICGLYKVGIITRKKFSRIRRRSYE